MFTLHANEPPASAPAPVPPAALGRLGRDLVRPECVLATRAGDVYCSDWRGGVTHIRPGGSQISYLGTLPGGAGLKPNGIALEPDGSFLVAHLGDDRGGVYRLARDGDVRPVLEALDGAELPPANFVALDAAGRVWITVSTRRRPRASAYRRDVADGFIAVLDGRGARIVADGLGYTNEAVMHPDGTHLYVNETFGRRLTRFCVDADARLSRREVVTEFSEGTYPDGLAFDAEGCAWITSIVSNRIVRVAPDGSQSMILEDADAAHVGWCEAAYRSGTMGRAHLDCAAGSALRNISSLAFGGPDLRTAYVGCLLGNALASFRTPVAGYPPVHWNW